MEKEKTEFKWSSKEMISREVYNINRKIVWDDEAKAVFEAFAGSVKLPEFFDSDAIIRRLRGKE